MGVSTGSSRDAALLAAVREGLAAPFADAVSTRLPAVVEVLEQQLMQTSDREQWKPLKSAIALLKDSQKSLGARAGAQVAARFDAKLKGGVDSLGQTARISLESLALVADDQMQEEIVLGNATRRLKEQSDEELFALTQRIAAILGRDNLPDEINPVFPRIFARGLLDAIAEAGGNAPSRLAAFSAFGPVVLEVVPQAYAAVNRMLREKGVLPEFKKAYGAPVNPVMRAAPSPGAPAPGAPSPAFPPLASTHDPAASTLERLLSGAAARAAIPAQTATAAPQPGAAGLVTIQVRPELLAALRALESRMPASVAVAAPATGAAAGATDFIAAEPLYPLVIPRIKREMGAALTPSDAVVADIVAALFERMFADARLADAFKAQVGRLQLPVFKAVMQDRGFFTERKHPIRALIDVMAQLGAAESTVRVDDREPVAWVAAAVEHILEECAEDPTAFTRAERHLAEILERHREAALELDEAVQAIRREESRLAAVREASLAIAHRLSSGNYAPEVAAFLYRGWRDVLVFDFLAGGEDGDDWKSDIEALDDLLWMMTPRFAQEDRDRMVSLLPSLLFRLRLGYQRAATDAELARHLMEEMKELHTELARSPAAAAHGRKLRKATLTEATVPAPEDYTATLHVSSASLAEEGLHRGAWFEFVDADGTRRRCRLGWMSPVQGTCVFKDLEKNRSFAISLEELREKRRGGAALSVDGPGVAQASIEGAIEDVAKSLAS